MYYNVQVRDHIYELKIASRPSLKWESLVSHYVFLFSVDALQDLSRLPFRGSDWPHFLQPTYIRQIVSS